MKNVHGNQIFRTFSQLSVKSLMVIEFDNRFLHVFPGHRFQQSPFQSFPYCNSFINVPHTLTSSFSKSTF